jgi:glutathione synthase/RimK-type ligase-like ATP-grasp enzyme
VDIQVPTLIVVNDPKDWPLQLEGVELVPAKVYLSDARYINMRDAKVFNLCRSYRYQSIGYYVSLLAEARRHKPVPTITTIQDLKSQSIVRTYSDELDDLIQKSLAPLQSKEFILSVYFGRNLAKRYDNLSMHLFRLFPAPFLRALFAYNEKNRKWYLKNIGPVEANDIPSEHRQFVVGAAREFIGRRRPMRRRVSMRYDLAILHNPKETEPPSNPKALQRFVRSAESLGLAAELIGKEDYGRLAEFDALFIRETTGVTHHTYRFARKAAAEGLVVVDDPESILKCTNKVFLAELMEKHKIPVPKTVIVHRDNAKSVPQMLGLPCILKKPDSSFSLGVVKAESEKELSSYIDDMLDRSELLIAQEYMPTGYDWRVGIFDRQPLYVCKYYMAGGHWQIISRDENGTKTGDGMSETLPVEHAPTGVVRAALRAANLIGDGLYGVDIKQSGKSFYVLEVNDNPNIDAGIEDAVLKEELYLRIMRVILRRIEQRKEKGYQV